MVYKFFDKKVFDGGAKNETRSHQELAEELHREIIREFEKRKVYSSFKDNIWEDDLADMQLKSQFYKGIRMSCSFKR